MARLDTTGLDDVIDEMIRMREDAGPVADKMLLAGAKEAKKAWKKAAKKHRHQDTGEMIKAIGHSKPRTVNGVRTMEIYPRGKDSKGVRNAEKAFITHYGKRGQPGSHWVDEADEEAAETGTSAMAAIWDEHIKGGT